MMDQSIPEILSFLKEKCSLEDKNLSFVQGMLMGCEKKIEEEKRRINERYMKIIAERTEVYKENFLLLYERIDELKNEKNEKEAHYEKKIKEFLGRISLLEEEMGKNNEVQFNSVENCNGKSRNEGIHNINLVPTEKNCPGDQSLQCTPSARGFAPVESNSDKQKETDHSEEADPLPLNLASEHGDPARHNLNADSDKLESSPDNIIDDNDDEMATNEMACASNRCGLGVNLAFCPPKKEVHVQDTSNSIQKRKRSTNEGENSGGKVVPCIEQNLAFIRQCDVKIEVKNHSELPPRRSDKPNELSNGNDLDSDNEGRKWLSEDDFCSAFEKDAELCLNAVSALYRQQISENKSSYLISQIDKMSITRLGLYLTGGDPENKLRRTISEVRLEDHGRCKRLAIRHCHQLFQIYHSKKDRMFCSGAGIL